MLKRYFLQFLLITSAFSAPQINEKCQESADNLEQACSLADEDKPFVGHSNENSPDFWQLSGQKTLEDNIKKSMNENVAKNLIILVADGMSIPTQMATRMYMGGEEKVLSFEKFPYVGLSKTYCVDSQVADSACSATAFLSGIKTNFGVVSLDASNRRYNCSSKSVKKNHVESIFKYAQDAKKATGFVTNTRVTHATTAAIYANSPSRYFENDSQTPPGCDDIALQLIHGNIGRNLDVVLGGGYREFLPADKYDPHGRVGVRTDNRDLIKEMLLTTRRSDFVYDRNSLKRANVKFIDKLFGVFSKSHMKYHLFNDKTVEPTLIEMTLKALQMVAKNPNGYVLLIENGRIDHGHHKNRAKLALEETVQFHNVVNYVKSQVDERETLIVVTADHSHTMTVSGYPKRRHDILALGGFSPEDEMPYFTLSYANGMGFSQHFNESGRNNPLDMDFNDPLFMHPTTVPLNEATHAGDDVGVYAIGPYSHLFTGVYEQHYIAHAMMYATCLGPEKFTKSPSCDESNVIKISFILLAFNALTFFMF
ncbi:CLUMA_CG002913, isoform A [Clunio marinus]|uniref:Alkaline phosphatase n=1 Tax=Clunio marinus TaxID=568069 RepID=A0A1J1HM51_9DIPT|nr:CLUMA_CG002913, isoform A [Clunio marinus]